MSVRMSALARHCQAEAIGLLVEGGKCLVCSGTRPESVDTPCDDDAVIASLDIPSSVVSVDDGVLSIDSVAATAEHAGVAQWFRLVNEFGETIIDGTVGRLGVGRRPSDMPMTRVDILSGDSVTIKMGRIDVPTEDAQP